MYELRIKSKDEGEIDTILAEDIDFTGDLSFTKPLMIKGKFSGQIQASGDLYIGDNAYIEARVEANVVSLKGKIKGNIYAKSMVELFSSATVEGDVTAPNILMESGCRFNGMCNMQPGKKDVELKKRNG